jgi:hypothetical protein
MTALVATEEEKTWVAILEQLLNQESADKLSEAMNFRVSRESTGQELVLYQEAVSNYQPEIIILALFVGNDVTGNSRLMTRAPRIYFDLAPDGGVRRRPYSALEGRTSAWLNQHSRLLRLVQDRQHTQPGASSAGTKSYRDSTPGLSQRRAC